jgi:hypothetical protein
MRLFSNKPPATTAETSSPDRQQQQDDNHSDEPEFHIDEDDDEGSKSQNDTSGKKGSSLLSGDIVEEANNSIDGEDGIIREVKGSTSMDSPDLAANGSQKSARVTWKDIHDTGINFLEDDPSTMTYARRIALFLMKRYGWYNPRLKATDIPEDETESAEDVLHPLLLANMHGEQTSSRNLAAEDINKAYPFTHCRRENPSLEKAWAYFEHVALSRYVIEEKKDASARKKCIVTRIVCKLFCKGGKQLKRAEPGEKDHPTALYQPMFTPHAQLGDFGLGIGLYFSTLRAITILTFFAGLLNIPNLLYFSSADYTPGLSNDSFFNNISIANLLQGSAICTDMSWVYCENCNDTDFSDYYDSSRRAYAVKSAFLADALTDRLSNSTETILWLRNNANVNETGTFFLKNNCEQSNRLASAINYGTLVLMMVGAFGLNIYLKRMEIAYDEDEQTAQDYSVVVHNPPGDSTNPQEWHDFFRDNFGAHLTACTIAVDNDLLVRSLVERRELLRKIELMCEPGTSLDVLTLAGIAAKEERERRFFGHLKAMLVPGVAELFARIAVLTAKVQGLAQQTYPATNVFLTFETEADQRKVLQAYNLGSLDVSHNNTSKVKPEHLFRGKHILKVAEPDEPNTVRWQDLNEKWKECLKQQLLTGAATLAAIVVIAFLVWALNGVQVEWAAIAIAVFNSVFPMFAKLLTSFEAHASEGGKQRSLYFKIALFRWANTAVVITIITPFTKTLTNGALINQIYALFFAEIVTTNAIQLLDPFGHLQRHILAPRAATQDAMNLGFQGQPVSA